MKLLKTLRFDKAEDISFTKHRNSDSTKGVWLIEAPLSTCDAESLGCGFLANNKFDSHKLGEDIEQVSVEFTPSGDMTPFELSPEKISKPVIEPLEGGLRIRLRIHVIDGHVKIIDSFFDRDHVGTFSLLVRPLEASLFDTEHHAAPETYIPTAEEIAASSGEQATITGTVDLTYNDDKVIAKISPGETEGGFAAVYSATANLRHPYTLKETQTPAFPSEREAIECAAASIRFWARDRFNQLTGKQRGPIAKLMTWAEQRMSQEQLRAVAENAAVSQTDITEEPTC